MKRNTFILTAITLFIGILTSCSPKEKAVTLANWMQQIEGQTPICKISIPATHDSGALLGGAALQCQDITIREQLENGIRGFDIRLQAEPNKKLGVYHSVQYQNITWEDNVLPDFISFLKENGILSVFHYIPLHSAPAGLKYGEFRGEDEYTTKESERLARLPMYYGLTMEQVDYIISKVKEFYSVCNS